ncbi:hypothetical protein, unlikely [Trypanosoma brucei gambiense DAL972]|uniref:Uncharacterized protein n=1 Tax=Trypanosoma brucei gambiense (strain MHOM/CI/86/DAL972) TaxID=679716 RepID=D0A5S7_TRYB9|nr:hypothetical protein, unlikely [Trypanosoma brucei gambiense DAL972]CBH17028.1 hypothetical protein, unlikely [Trypanosoma brucei gambiense DAL972]|eukprot:XP_011779292.1 hypothetical protein, unlikely [Trypanosoma brucei gambiense DAL972]
MVAYGMYQRHLWICVVVQNTDVRDAVTYVHKMKTVKEIKEGKIKKKRITSTMKPPKSITLHLMLVSAATTSTLLCGNVICQEAPIHCLHYSVCILKSPRNTFSPSNTQSDTKHAKKLKKNSTHGQHHKHTSLNSYPYCAA